MVNTLIRGTDTTIRPVPRRHIGEKGAGGVLHVLLVSRGDPATTAMRKLLGEEGIDCVVSGYGESLLDALEERLPDVLLIDIESLPIPATEGISFARKLKTTVKVPVITIMSATGLRVFNVAMGVDDFVVKPCSATELSIRIRQTFWRLSNIDEGDIIKQGDLIMDLSRYEVSVGGRLVSLSFKEYELLRALITSRGRVMTREVLLDEVWGHDYFGGDRTVDVHIRRLRSKIEDADHSFIETVRNVGYRFRDGGS